jgi:hypothetical protein
VSARIGPSVSVQKNCSDGADKVGAPKFVALKFAMAIVLLEGFAHSRCESIGTGGFALGKHACQASSARRRNRKADICELRANGMGILKIGKTLKVGTSVVQRVISAAAE